MSPGKVLLLPGILDGLPEVGLAGKWWEGAAPTEVQTLLRVAAIRLELPRLQLLSDDGFAGQGLYQNAGSGVERKSQPSLSQVLAVIPHPQSPPAALPSSTPCQLMQCQTSWLCPLGP